MNCKDTKSIDIVAFLEKVGFSGKAKGPLVWYSSPLREEKTSSFTVNPVYNRWKDWGSGKSGDLLDLVKEMYNTDTNGALHEISKSNPDKFIHFSKANIITELQEPGISIKHIQPIQNKALLEYLKNRKIPVEIARQYTQEAYYMVSGKIKPYFSLCFKNDKGGYELRNMYSKSGTSPKYITTIPGSKNTCLNLFEGFFDFISAMAYYQVTKPAQTTIVLNSLSFLENVIQLLPNFEKVNLFLDNDPAGLEAVEKIRSLHPCTIDKAKVIYPLHKDFNEFIVNN